MAEFPDLINAPGQPRDRFYRGLKYAGGQEKRTDCF